MRALALLVALFLLGAAVGEDPDPDVGRFGYDCEVAYKHWRTSWNADKQQWCCQYVKRGCVNEALQYDCNEGKKKWRTGWSSDKKDWCCSHHRIGCPWTCNDAEQHIWSPEHREWCCKKHPPAGCTLELQGPAQQESDVHARHFDCRDQRESEWSSSKRVWCCSHSGHGCVYDCNVGTADWQTRWSEAKKNYCCESAPPRGCASVEDYNCSAGVRLWKKGWSSGKKEWCCKHSPPRGCDEPYDCFTGLKNLEVGWSSGKKAYCCENHAPNGCEVDPFNCLDGMANWRNVWPDVKKQWCCTHKSPLGCETVADAYSCIESERHSWSAAEQRWCCHHGRTTLGCTSKRDRYCSVNFHGKWSHHRVCYCCKHHGIACPPVYYPPNIPENAVICTGISDSDLGLFETLERQQPLITRAPEARLWGRMLLVVPGAAVLFLLPTTAWVLLRWRGMSAPFFTRELDDQRDALATNSADEDLTEQS